MTNNINGIDVSKYFIEIVDEGGSTINYKILPNIERLLVERIFEQNQQLARLQEENEGLKSLNDFNVQKIEVLQEENEKLKEKNKGLLNLCNNGGALLVTESAKTKKYKQALEEIRGYCDEQNLKADYTACYITNKIDEVLNDRD